MDLPGAVVDDEISDRDSSEVGSLSSPSPPQVIILQCEHTDGPAQKCRSRVYVKVAEDLKHLYFFL